MKPIAKKWIPYIEADIDAAKILLSSKGKSRWTNILVLWHCQQAIEKSFKAIIAARGGEILKIHDLAKLYSLAGIDFSEGDIRFILVLNNYYLRSRYPDLINKPLANPDDKTTEKYLKQTLKLHLWLIGYLKKIK